MRTMRIIKFCDDVFSRTEGLMDTEIGIADACVFLFDDYQRLSFWGDHTPQDLYLNCVLDGVVVESVFIPAMTPHQVLSVGEYQLAFEALEDLTGSVVEFIPGRIRVYGVDE